MDLSDVPALNQRLGLTGDRHLVPFSGIHVSMMRLDRWERGYLQHIPNYQAVLDGYAQIGHTYTGVANGKPVCSFGIISMWPGVAEMWMVPDMSLGHHRYTFHRATFRWINIMVAELQLVRLQATVHTGNDRADKWIRSLYFQKEGVLKAFGPEGADYSMYARLFNGRNF